MRPDGLVRFSRLLLEKPIIKRQTQMTIFQISLAKENHVQVQLLTKSILWVEYDCPMRVLWWRSKTLNAVETSHESDCNDKGEILIGNFMNYNSWLWPDIVDRCIIVYCYRLNLSCSTESTWINMINMILLKLRSISDHNLFFMNSLPVSTQTAVEFSIHCENSKMRWTGSITIIMHARNL